MTTTYTFTATLIVRVEADTISEAKRLAKEIALEACNRAPVGAMLRRDANDAVILTAAR